LYEWDIYREWAPPLPWQRAVVCCWEQRVGAGRTQRVVPDGCADVLLFDDGHIEVVGLHDIATLADLPAPQVGPLFQTAQRLARAVESALKADGTFIAINNKISQSVPHLHVHVIPRRKGDGLKGFFWPRVAYKADGEAERARDAIRSAAARIAASGS